MENCPHNNRKIIPVSSSVSSMDKQSLFKWQCEDCGISGEGRQTETDNMILVEAKNDWTPNNRLLMFKNDFRFV